MDDTPEQTKAVLLTQAEGEERQPIDLTLFKALQRLLELERPQAVVPFAVAMAQGCDPTALRLRRDFKAVLSLVKAHAILHAHLRNGTGSIPIRVMINYLVAEGLYASNIRVKN